MGLTDKNSYKCFRRNKYPYNLACWRHFVPYQKRPGSDAILHMNWIQFQNFNRPTQISLADVRHWSYSSQTKKRSQNAVKIYQNLRIWLGSLEFRHLNQCRSRGGSRGRVQGVRTPPLDDLRFSNTTGILPKKKTMWFIGVEVE